MSGCLHGALTVASVGRALPPFPSPPAPAPLGTARGAHAAAARTGDAGVGAGRWTAMTMSRGGALCAAAEAREAGGGRCRRGTSRAWTRMRQRRMRGWQTRRRSWNPRICATDSACATMRGPTLDAGHRMRTGERARAWSGLCSDFGAKMQEEETDSSLTARCFATDFGRSGERIAIRSQRAFVTRVSRK